MNALMLPTLTDDGFAELVVVVLAGLLVLDICWERFRR